MINLTRLRNERGLTKRDVARMLDINEKQYFKIEALEVKVKYDVAIALEKIFDCSITYLLSDEILLNSTLMRENRESTIINSTYIFNRGVLDKSRMDFLLKSQLRKFVKEYQNEIIDIKIYEVAYIGNSMWNRYTISVHTSFYSNGSVNAVVASLDTYALNAVLEATKEKTDVTVVLGKINL